MKRIHAVWVLAWAITFFNVNSIFAQSDYAIVSRGPDWNVHQKTVVQNGTNAVHRYTELATGMNYTNSYGQLVASSEQITILPNGGAAATQGRHQVYFPSDIYNGVLEVVTPDGRHLQSRPLGVCYDDGSNTVFIAQLKDAPGYLTSSNQVTYRDAFTGFKADLVCTYRRGGFECDLVFRQQPPTPDQYGLDDSFATLEMVTEFFNTPDPQAIPAGSDDWFGLQDETLKFGKLTMTHGKAFLFNSHTNSDQSTASAVPVYKSWQHIGGRTFLIESVPVLNIADNLDALPLTAGNDKMEKGQRKLAANWKLKIKNSKLADALPAFRAPTQCTNQILLAMNDRQHEPGVVLDYNEIDTDQTDFTFQSGQTYYIDEYVNFSGTTVFQGGAVLKYPEPWGGLLNLGNFICQATADHPIIFTSANDNSVGETIPGSTGTPGYVNGFIWENLSNNNSLYQHMRFYYGGWSDGDSESTGNGAIYDDYFTADDVQFINCMYAIDTGGGEGAWSGVPDAVLNNVLFANCSLCIGPDSNGFQGPDVVNGNNMTMDNSILGGFDYYAGSYFSFTNSIFSRSGYVPIAPEMNGSHNGFYNNSVFGLNAITSTHYPFTNGAAAHYYIVATNAFHNAGTTDIDPDLLAELQTMTTYAPQDGSWPDTSGTDLGYHYPVNEDSDYDGLPDWWELHWFGTYAYSGTNVDSSGNTLLSDYQNGLDPNIISFAIDVANNYVRQTNASLQLDVAGGIPYYYAALVDSTNFATTNWTAYTGTNLTVNLGTNEGWHDIWIGLKGYPTNATVTWTWKRLKLDTTAPQLTLTSPSNSTVMQSMIEVTGYAPETIESISYDLTNALGLVTNLDAGITQRDYDTNTWDFGTNYFEALDIPLTNGVNTLIFHATDLAGNVTTTNFSFTVDYTAKTNPPVISVTWPQNGMQLCGNNFTMRGQVGDPTVAVTATITDTNGDTNIITGEVERNGRWWVENVPLNAGTNWVSITMSDVVSNMTTTNMILIGSGMTLTMDAVGDTSQLWQPTINLTGKVSDTTAAIWVNGVQGNNNGDGTWAATNVPVSDGGVASFDLKAIPAGGGDPDASVDVDKPAEIYLVGDEQNADDTYKSVNSETWPNIGEYYDLYAPSFHYDHTWYNGFGGSGSYVNSWNEVIQSPANTWPDGTYQGNFVTDNEWDAEGYGFWTVTSPGGTGIEIGSEAPVGTLYGPYDIYDRIANEHCSVNVQTNTAGSWDWPDGSHQTYSLQKTHARKAQTTYHLKTGGKSKLQNLFQISASATEILDQWAEPQYADTPTAAIPPQNVQVLDKYLLADGNLWTVLPDNTDRDVTPIVKNKDFYNFTVGATKYKSYFEIFVNQPYPGPVYYSLETTGHAFWQFKTDAPDNAMQYISSSLTVYLNHNWGFYPHGADCGLIGQLGNDDSHGYAVKRVFYIGFPNLLAGLQFTRGLENAPPEYCIAIKGYSCVGAAREAGSNAGVWLPSDWTPQNFGAGILVRYQKASVLSDDTPRYSQ